MSRHSERLPLGDFARAGFQRLAEARDGVLQVSEEAELPVEWILGAFTLAADPDAALTRVISLFEHSPRTLRGLDEQGWRQLTLLFGASPALGDFFCRNPEQLRATLAEGGHLVSAAEARRELLLAIGADPTQSMPLSEVEIEASATALRIRYRELLARIVLHDLNVGARGSAADCLEDVAESLSDLADAALEAALASARSALMAGVNGPPVSNEVLQSTRLAIVAMGKCGARELNVVSDVDVIFVAQAAGDTEGASESDTERALRTATRLATETMRALHDPGIEPPLWQVDANLRPEGKHGALVRSLDSMRHYYERWAKTWEFQALLKARPAAGDLALGEAFVSMTRPMVWESSNREDFVGSVQRMRERVTEHIGPEALERQLKLGPGGLRDVEFSVQLLQLVHGQYDESLRLAGTLPALAALVRGGYVAREDGELLAADYRLLRVLEHRLQLRELRRTALMPADTDGLRVLARASRAALTGDQLRSEWWRARNQVRELHLKIFYAPLLHAVAALPGEEFMLGTKAAEARLQSIGFRDPRGAMRHLNALTKGGSRTAKIQRNLLPVLLQWLADGRDPDYGLLAFRRVSEANRDSPWYLRLLRDGAEAAERLTRVLSSSKFAAELLETIPGAVAWLERDELLQPQPLEALRDEMRALASRRDSVDEAAAALRAVHRREVLRMALGRLTFVLDDAKVAAGLDAAHSALLDALLLSLRAEAPVPGASDDRPSTDDALELALIGMGRFGGRELGFASDIDLVAVYRGSHTDSDASRSGLQREAERLVAELRRLVSDPRFAVDLDFDLRPEGRNGPIARSLEAYRRYYETWSLTWEAQALLRARAVAGSASLGGAFLELADPIRYPRAFGEDELREIRRIKARVESERLPQGADPRRHLKLGPGGISDVEWLVQLLQMQHAADVPALRTTSTLEALDTAVKQEFLDPEEASLLRESWTFASQLRSALKLWSGRSSDTLPTDRSDLEGIAGILGMPEGRTTELEERWFSASRRARAVFERRFFGYDDEPRYPR